MASKTEVLGGMAFGYVSQFVTAWRRDTERTEGKQQWLAALEVTTALKAKVRDDERLAVALARDEGATWNEIAEALGISRPAVIQRFNR